MLRRFVLSCVFPSIPVGLSLITVSSCATFGAEQPPTPVSTSKTADMSIQASNQPRIDSVNIAGQYIAIHFYTDPFRTYYLQYRDNLSTGSWVTVRTFRQLPIANHLVATDDFTNKFRFYRLAATP